MSAKTNDEKPATEYPSLAAALAAFQADLPTVHKGATGQVGQNRNYKYADLSDLNGAVLPRLGAVGLSFSAKPTVTADGRFILAYVLRHVSGDEDGGEWPLPEGNSQAIGSALTYARRYCLQAVTGVAPDEDDDGRAAGDTRVGQPRSQAPRSAPQNGHQGNGSTRRPSPPAADEPAPEPPADGPNPAAFDVIKAAVSRHGWDKDKVADRYSSQFGEPIEQVKSVPRASAFVKLIEGDPSFAAAPAASGVAQ